MAESREEHREVGRFNAFTDGVMVVSMTLLILNIELPDTVRNLDGAALWRELGTMVPHYFGYVVSFLVISQYWLGYTEYFGSIRAIDRGFARLCILFLLVVGFIPFVTALLSENSGSLATSLYAATMVVVSGLLILMSFYAIRHELIEPRFPDSARWREVVPWLQTSAVFGGSIVIAQFSADLAKLSWLLLMVPYSLLGPRRASGRSDGEKRS